jgi:hypothetical protein
MAWKRKRAKQQSKPSAMHPDVVRLAILTAIIDPEGVRRDLSSGQLPYAFSIARDLIEKIDDFMKGREETPYISRLIQLRATEQDKSITNLLEKAEQRKLPIDLFSLLNSHRILENVRRTSAIQEWRLEEGNKFSLLQATKQSWCRYKDERRLLKFLQRNGFPFDYSNGDLRIMQLTYEKALEADLKRRRKLDNARKVKRKKEKREIARGKQV